MITVENFFNKVASEIRSTYFPNEDHGRTENKNYWKATVTMENFSNGVLSYDKLIDRLSKSCKETPNKIHEIVSKYVESFEGFEYKLKNLEIMREIETYLPVFTGFYGTLFGDIIEREEDNILEDENLDLDIVKFEYKKFMEDVSKECVGVFEEAFNRDLGTNIDISFENLISPREYNFTNDLIDVTFKVSDEDFEKIKVAIIENKDEISEMIEERFSSRDGFVSLTSTDFDEWIEDMEHYQKFGALLEMLCEVLEVISEEEMVDLVQGNVSMDYEIKN